MKYFEFTLPHRHLRWCWQGAPPPSSSGPSKNAAKKAEKAAKKAAAKGAKSAPVAGSCVSPAAAPASAASRSSLPSMYLGSDGPGPLKCLTAAKFFGVEVEAADTNPAGEGKRYSRDQEKK